MRIGDGLRGRRVRVARSDGVMGPGFIASFAGHGVEVVGAPGPRAAPGAVEAAIASAGRIDLPSQILTGRTIRFAGGWA